MAITTSAQDLVARANARIQSLEPAEVARRRSEPGTLVVDVRDVRERRRDGYFPGALHVPRGMLEFWIDPASPYHKPELAAADSFILYCNKGWRSALATATLQDMGLEQVAHRAGGFERWCAEGGEIENA